VTFGFPAITATSDDDGHVTVAGSGFPPDTSVTVDIRSKPVVLGSVTTDAAGSFTRRFDTECRVEDGAHTVTATAATGEQASSAVEVEGCSDAERDEHGTGSAPVAQPVVSTPRFTG